MLSYQAQDTNGLTCQHLCHQGIGQHTWMLVSSRMAESGSALLPAPMRKGALCGITLPTCCASSEPCSVALAPEADHCPSDALVSELSPAHFHFEGQTEHS